MNNECKCSGIGGGCVCKNKEQFKYTSIVKEFKDTALRIFDGTKVRKLTKQEDESLRLWAPKEVGYWCFSSMKWAVTEKPSWRCRVMMRIFFDWRYEEVKDEGGM